jgi:hypothetical protein
MAPKLNNCINIHPERFLDRTYRWSIRIQPPASGIITIGMTNSSTRIHIQSEHQVSTKYKIQVSISCSRLIFFSQDYDREYVFLAEPPTGRMIIVCSSAFPLTISPTTVKVSLYKEQCTHIY